MQEANIINLRLTEADRVHLRTGAAALGVELSAAMLNTLSSFADLLGLWGRRINLVSCGSARELVDRHFLDSLAIEPFMTNSGTLVDLGSGAGLPGIPLAVVSPERRILLVEVRRRRANFLREARRTLRLQNVEVLELNAEDPPEVERRLATFVASRAVWAGPSILSVASRWLRPEGRLLWMRSEPVSRAVGSEELSLERTVRYRIGTDRVRVIEVFTTAS